MADYTVKMEILLKKKQDAEKELEIQKMKTSIAEINLEKAESELKEAELNREAEIIRSKTEEAKAQLQARKTNPNDFKQIMTRFNGSVICHEYKKDLMIGYSNGYVIVVNSNEYTSLNAMVVAHMKLVNRSEKATASDVWNKVELKFNDKWYSFNQLRDINETLL